MKKELEIKLVNNAEDLDNLSTGEVVSLNIDGESQYAVYRGIENGVMILGFGGNRVINGDDKFLFRHNYGAIEVIGCERSKISIYAGELCLPPTDLRLGEMPQPGTNGFYELDKLLKEVGL